MPVVAVNRYPEGALLMGENYNPPTQAVRTATDANRVESHCAPMDQNLHSPQRRLIELRIEHADLDSLIDRARIEHPDDELALRRLKKRRLQLRDQIARLEGMVDPPEPA